jgi:hypothetical protein
MSTTRELLSQNRSDEYRSYVVRLLRSSGQQAWRIAVEEVSTRQQANFKNVAGLADFFAAQMASREVPAGAPPAEATDGQG